MANVAVSRQLSQTPVVRGVRGHCSFIFLHGPPAPKPHKWACRYVSLSFMLGFSVARLDDLGTFARAVIIC